MFRLIQLMLLASVTLLTPLTAHADVSPEGMASVGPRTAMTIAASRKACRTTSPTSSYCAVSVTPAIGTDCPENQVTPS